MTTEEQKEIEEIYSKLKSELASTQGPALWIVANWIYREYEKPMKNIRKELNDTSKT